MTKNKYTKEEKLILAAATKILDKKTNVKEFKVPKTKKKKVVPLKEYKKKHYHEPVSEVHIIEKKPSLFEGKENIDICITFDTTGSQYPCLTQLRRAVQVTVNRLFEDIPNIRVAIIAHGDYVDKDNPYVIKTLNFTTDKDKICDFVNNVEKTNGGDCPECYELVLHHARTLNWQAKKSKAIIMIGDDVPHEKGYYYGVTVDIDWKNEVALINQMGINIYGVHCMPECRSHSKKFYEYISNNSDGKYLTLDQFASINDVIMIVCYKQQGNDRVEIFEKEITAKGRMSRNIASILQTITGKTYKTFKTSGGLKPVPTGRFQILDVDEDDNGIMISEFVTQQGASFNKGRGFYEMTKPEKIQGYKEIVLMEKDSGDIYNGDQVRILLHLPPQSGVHDGDREDVKIKPVDLDKYFVFVQSTSYNRKLVGGTRLLYEVEDWKK